MGSITLTWNDTNTTETGHKVYRSLTPMTVGSLPAPIATVGADIASYMDSTVVAGETYYYRVAAVRNLSEAVSAEISVAAIAGALLVAPSGLVLELIAEVAETPPTTIGQASNGGYYIGDITVADGGADDGTYAVIMAGVAANVSLTWKTTNTATVGTDSLTNGLANTLAMEAADPAIHPATSHCLNYVNETYDDWYLPAKDELNLAWVNLVSLAGLAMEAQYYWASSQVSVSEATLLSFSHGSPGSNSKAIVYLVRPVRRIKKS